MDSHGAPRDAITSLYAAAYFKLQKYNLNFPVIALTLSSASKLDLDSLINKLRQV